MTTHSPFNFQQRFTSLNINDSTEQQDEEKSLTITTMSQSVSVLAC